MACLLALGLAACVSEVDDDSALAEEDLSSLTSGTCIGEAPVTLAKAGGPGEYSLVVEAASATKTSWAEAGNEAVVLEVLRGRQRVGHLVLHQGQDRFAYGMHVGDLGAGEALSVRVSDLTASRAQKRACISKVTLAPISGAMAEGIAHAPIFVWPKKKVFDDLPVVVGWSRSQKSYQAVYSNENGGTVKQCGGGAKGIQAEIARWGRACDIEGAFSYGGAGSFGRCTGGTSLDKAKLRMEEQHPRLYYGDGHNRLFESRGGYGKTCGGGGPEKADGDIAGWNVDNPGSEPEKDDAYSIVLRPLPVDMDALGFAQFQGRREGLVDTYAPWLYRLTHAEIAREGKVDGDRSFSMDRYMFVDIYALDVGGHGGSYCSPLGVSGGFVVRAITGSGVVSSGPQMTDDFSGGGAIVKRIAVPLAPGVKAGDIKEIVLDAYDDDGVYWLALGDAFVPEPKGTNGATLEYVHKGKQDVKVYVDDGNTDCTNGVSLRDNVAYPCKGTSFGVKL
jgi:hypothetical protein